MRYKMIISYDGTEFNGWEGCNGVFIKNVLEDAFFHCFKEKIKIFCSGRTDKGVHAIYQTCHFDSSHFDSSHFDSSLKIYIKKWKYNIPKTINIIDIQEVTEEFHARFSTIERQYMYLCYFSKEKIPIFENRAVFLEKKLDIDKINSVIPNLLGTHDFSTFCPKNYNRKKILTMKNIYITKEIWQNLELYRFYFIAKSFAHNQIRKIIASFLKLEIWTREDFILKFNSRESSPFIAPACGLYFLQSIVN